MVFVFDQQLLIPEAFKNYTLKTEAIQPDEQRRLLKSNNDTSKEDQEAEDDSLEKVDKSSVYLQQFIDFQLKRGSPDSAPLEDLIFDMFVDEFSDYRMVL